LLERCDALAFCVPPDVQVDLAVRAAGAGKALLLEKPIALDVPSAERLAGAVEGAGVGTQIVLSWRYAAPIRALLARLASHPGLAGRGEFVNGAMLDGPFATPWRLRHGPLLDLGPHVIDALDAALGPVVHVRAHGRFDRWVGLLLDHDGGAVSEVSLSCTAALPTDRAGIEVYTADTRLAVDTTNVFDASATAALVDEFVATARHGGHPLDVHHGLRIQRIIGQALDDLGR
jgi:predicted dehydrogenase